ncbi:thioredoxin [Striga asiatica]|uniref:Thioredoxin n=1 Tax=Striga asiatica TaxID=4170 RepID=A0A5A7Q840_STRAF|nr:thioredoxin [Striga asiatica]
MWIWSIDKISFNFWAGGILLPTGPDEGVDYGPLRINKEKEMVLADMYTKLGIPWGYCPKVTLKRVSNILKNEFSFWYNLKNEFNLVMNANFMTPLGCLAFVKVPGLVDDCDQEAAIWLNELLLSAPKEFRVGLMHFYFAGSEADAHSFIRLCLQRNHVQGPRQFWMGALYGWATFNLHIQQRETTGDYYHGFSSTRRPRDVASEFEVQAMPTFVLLKRGKVVERVIGAKKDELQNKIIKHREAPKFAA